MAQCKDIVEEASEYIDGDLPLRRRISLFYHLVICKCCRIYLQNIKKTINTVRTLRPKEPAIHDIKDFAERLRVESESEKLK